MTPTDAFIRTALGLTLSALTCAAVADDVPTLRQEEAFLIAASKTLVQRNGDMLKLRIANGKVLTIRDESQCDEDDKPLDFDHCIHYFFIRHFIERHGFLIRALYYEGDRYYWINDLTGERTPISDVPHFSPRGDRMIVVRSDDADYLGTNGIEIWKWSHGRITREWHVDPDTGIVEFSRWENNDRIALTTKTWPSDETLPASVFLTKYGWQFREDKATQTPSDQESK